jgi:hypothetical protein
MMKNGLLVVCACIIFSFELMAQTAPDTSWTRQLPGKRGNSIIQTNDGGFIAVGHISGNQWFGDSFIIKTDSLGDIVWENIISSVDMGDCAYSIKQTNDDYFIITGYYNHRSFLTKINTEGDSLWFRCYAGNPGYGIGISTSVDINEDGNIAFCGFNCLSYIVKTDSSGNQIWIEYYPDETFLEMSDCKYIQFLPGNEIAIAGNAAYHVHPGTDWSEAYLIKTDSLGNEIFYCDFQASSYPEFAYTNDSEFIYISDDKVYKVDSEGNDVWEIDIPFHSTCIITKENDFVIAGYNAGNPCVLKIDESGNQVWLATYNTDTNDYIYDIINTGDGGFALTGCSNDNFYIMKLNPEGSASINESIGLNNYKSTVFPNPFRTSTTIRFSLTYNSYMCIELFNIKGQKVKTLRDGGYIKGNHSLVWNGDDNNAIPVEPGVYFIILNVNGKTEAVNKCVFMK